MSTQAETNRTRYQATIRLTARERGALKRWLAKWDNPYHLIIDDRSLSEGVLRRVLDKAVKLKDK